jgi:hypothetical protein
MTNFFEEKLDNGILPKASLFLALTFLALVTLKTALSDCTIFSSENCSKIANSSTALIQDIVALKYSISKLEKSVAELECPPVIQTSQVPIEKIDEPLWKQGKIEALSGCWILDWDYKMREVETGNIIGVRDWRVCFDQGQRMGQQTLVFDDNINCVDQPITGEFITEADKVTLLLDDTKDVSCEHGRYVYQRKLYCKLASDASHAMCSSISRQHDKTWSSEKVDNVRLVRGGK